LLAEFMSTFNQTPTKMHSIQFLSVLSVVMILSLCACEIDKPQSASALALNLPDESYDYISSNLNLENLENPNTLLVGDISPEFPNSGVFAPGATRINIEVDNNEAATLGRVLFYDPQLSKNNSISCASCHQQSKAFADGQDLSQGFGGKLTSRNSMSFSNLATNNNFFWDSRQSFMNDLVTEPVTNHIEMGMEDMDALMEKLKKISYYPELFEDAYGVPTIDQARFSTAITQFLASITSTETTFDRELERDFEGYSEMQKLGMAIFFSDKAQCASCPSGANFAADDSGNGEYRSTAGTANIGLDLVYDDNGRNDGQFKIPSLRNIALTAPYMHDGRFNTLKEVIEHYNNNVKPHANLDDKLTKDGITQHLDLSSLEVDALAAFLLPLTDENMIKDPKFSNPFTY